MFDGFLYGFLFLNTFGRGLQAFLEFCFMSNDSEVPAEVRATGGYGDLEFLPGTSCEGGGPSTEDSEKQLSVCVFCFLFVFGAKCCIFCLFFVG